MHLNDKCQRCHNLWPELSTAANSAPPLGASIACMIKEGRHAASEAPFITVPLIGAGMPDGCESRGCYPAISSPAVA